MSQDRNRQDGRQPRQPGDQLTLGQTGQSSFYSPEAIRKRPVFPWQPAQSQEVIAHLDDFAVRLFRGELDHPYEERTRPGGVLVLFIPTCFQGPHHTLALSKMAYYMAETPVNPGIASVFSQAADNAAETDIESWMTDTVRAIEYGSLFCVYQRIQGVPASRLATTARAIRRNIKSVRPVLEAKDSTRRLAICEICATALQLISADYDGVPPRLLSIIRLLGEEFTMPDAAQQLTRGLMGESEWALKSAQAGATFQRGSELERSANAANTGAGMHPATIRAGQPAHA